VKSRVISIVVTAIIIVLSLVFVINEDTATMADAQAIDSKLGSVASMVGGLEERLRQHPDDGKGWLLLAKSYRHMGRMDDARVAYRNAEDLGSGDAAVAAQLYGLEIAGASQ
jgi:cytochrome c-type biogenesis protein CcmH/NrfG